MLYSQQNSLGLDNMKGLVHHLLIIYRFYRNCQTHNCHRVLHDQPDHLLPDIQHPGDQPARLAGHDHMITVVPGLPGQSSFITVPPRTGWSAHLYEATLCWICGSKSDWYCEGETSRPWTWK